MQFSLLFLLLPAFLSAASLDLAASKSEVEFLAVGQPSALRIRGKLDKEKVETPLKGTLSVEPSSIKGLAHLTLAAFNTGIELRDQHMKEKYLEVGKHPIAQLKFLNFDGKTFSGELFLHGVNKPISGTAEIKSKDKSFEGKFEFKIKLSDFAIEIPSYMGIKVAEMVTVTSHIEGMLK